VEAEVVERHRLAGQVGPDGVHVPVEVGDRRRRSTEMGEGRVATTDADGDPVAGVAGGRVRDGRTQLERGGTSGGGGERDPGIPGVVL
jgi:hypothetical protein